MVETCLPNPATAYRHRRSHHHNTASTTRSHHPEQAKHHATNHNKRGHRLDPFDGSQRRTCFGSLFGTAAAGTGHDHVLLGNDKRSWTPVGGSSVSEHLSTASTRSHSNMRQPKNGKQLRSKSRVAHDDDDDDQTDFARQWEAFGGDSPFEETRGAQFHATSTATTLSSSKSPWSPYELDDDDAPTTVTNSSGASSNEGSRQPRTTDSLALQSIGDDEFGNPTHDSDIDNDCFHLLQPPPPTDRSNRRKHDLEQRARHVNTYQGEMEPQGYRGQEAVVATPPSNHSNNNGSRFRGKAQHAAYRQAYPVKTRAQLPLQIQPQHPQRQSPPRNGKQQQQYLQLETIAEASEHGSVISGAERSHASSTHQNVGHIPMHTKAVSPPRHNKSKSKSTLTSESDSNSTNSDDDLDRMMEDFLNPDNAKHIGEGVVGMSDASTSLRGVGLQRDDPPPVQKRQPPTMTKAYPQQQYNYNIPVKEQQPPARLKDPPIAVTVSTSDNSSDEDDPHRVRRMPPSQPRPHVIPPSPQQQQQPPPPPPPPPPTRPQQQQDNHAPTHLDAAYGHEQEHHHDARSTHSQASAIHDDVDALNAVAMQHVHNGEYDMALAAFQQVLHLYKQHYGSVHPMVASAYHNLGTVHAKRAQLLLDDTLHQRHCRAQSLQCFQSAARAARDSLGRDHPNVAVSLVRIGFLLLQARQYNNAVITFQEALRIRQAHYGPSHGLVANLYNNLGVCYMHLGQFAHGRDLLDHALQIQRGMIDDLIQQATAQADAEEKKDANSPPSSRSVPAAAAVSVDLRSHYLELADTLFNIGGLALEWIRRQGPDVRHAQDAEDAFEESLELRKSVLGPKDPMVIQVKSLLDMSRAIPRPRSPGRIRGSAPVSPRSARNSSQVNWVSVQSPQSNESLSPASPHSSSSASHQRPAPGSQFSLSPPRLTAQPAASASQNESLYAQRSREANMAPQPSSPNRYRQPLEQSSPPRAAAQADYLEPPRVSRRAILDTDEGPDVERYSQVGKQSIVTSTASTVKATPPGRGNPSQQPQRSDIFRQDKGQDREFKHGGPPPITEVTYSQDEEDEGLYDSAALQAPAQTNIFVSPHWVPEISPDKVNGTPSSRNSSLQTSYSYDAEENCLLSDGLAAKGGGDLHEPTIPNVSPPRIKDGERKIMVVRPFRKSPDQGSSTGAFSPGSAGGTIDSPASREHDMEGEGRGTQYTIESYNQANNKDSRSATLNRARALLAANSAYLDSPQVQLSGKASFLESPDSIKNNLFSEKDEFRFGQDLEDGLAALGSNDDLHELYGEASQMLSQGRHAEAIAGFEEILLCQKRQYGPFHEDTAAALHNLGLAQLRAGNHHDAVNSFSEAVRIRKGVLGPEHPQVAASLVKCGISFLLLHRFEEALWSFREALGVRKKSLGALHPSTARIYNNIGCVHVEFNELREARRAFEGALDIQRNALVQDPEIGPIRFGTATTLCNLGYLYRYRGLHEKAALVLKEAADLQSGLLGPFHPTVLNTLDSLAEALLNSNQTTQAVNTYKQILQRFRAIDEDGSPRLCRAEAVLFYKMSKAYRNQKDWEQQINNLHHSLQAIRSGDGSGEQMATLEKRVLSDLREARELIEKNELKWV